MRKMARGLMYDVRSIWEEDVEHSCVAVHPPTSPASRQGPFSLLLTPTPCTGVEMCYFWL